MKSPSRFLVYVLIDPRDGQPFYVGRSSSGFRRAHAHAGERRERTRGLKALRIAVLAAEGKEPQAWPIAWARNAKDLACLETSIIRTWSKQYRLLNDASLGHGRCRKRIASCEKSR